MGFTTHVDMAWQQQYPKSTAWSDRQAFMVSPTRVPPVLHESISMLTQPGGDVAAMEVERLSLTEHVSDIPQTGRVLYVSVIP